MKKFFEEFRAFIARGNVLDMAVGVIIGGAFKTIVDSLTGDIINPILGLFGGTDLSSIKVHLLGDSYLNIGNFLNAVINFLLMALVLFIIVKAFNSTEAKLKALAEKNKEKEPEKPAGPTQEELLTQIRDLLAERDQK
ncbi:MAG: large conductance mechanosensitive channel protein MscL [Lachnospira sp.]|nr:large conductance mechanosensitive channel protein MscL [Lachnospira sp.]